MIPEFILSNGGKRERDEDAKKEQGGKRQGVNKNEEKKTNKKGNTSARKQFNKRRQAEQVARTMEKTPTSLVSIRIPW